jgi:hypothetical protein
VIVPVPVVVRIDSVGLSAAGPFGAGATFTVTMRGTPGGEGVLDVGEPPVSLRMQEGPPGQYAAAYTVRPGEAARARLVARLRLGGVEVSHPLGAVVIDGVPPMFTRVEPEPNSTVGSAQPTIAASFADRGPAGLRLETVRLWVDGREVRRAAVTASAVSYVPQTPLPAGRHRVQVAVADLAGNEATTSWTFVISPPTPAPAATATPPAPTPGPPPIPRPTPTPGAAPPTARATATPGLAPPVIVSPKPGDAIPSPLPVRGTAIPGTRVQVTIDYESSARNGPRGALGPVFATVNPDGSWDVQVRLPGNLGEGRLVITAVTLSGTLRSDPARVTIVIAVLQRDPEK